MTEKEQPLTVRILRFNPEKDTESCWVDYQVPRYRASRVLDALEFIQDEIDPSLGYRRHICHNLVCRSCMAQVNGHSRMTCQSVIRPDVTEITVEPLAEYATIRDLITDFAKKREAAQH